MEVKKFWFPIALACSYAVWPAVAHAQLELTIHPREKARIDDESEARDAAQRVAGNVTVADESQWSHARAQTVKDVTDYMPGVITQQRNGAESARLSVRGSGLANIFQGRGLLVMQDGIPINTADGGFEFPTIDPWLIRYAQVLRGANALGYGASNFGGAVDFITPNGTTNPGVQLRAEAGSFRTAHAQTTYGKSWKDGDMFASLTGFTQEGFRQQNEQDTSRFNANWGWKLSSNTTNRFYIGHTHSDAEIPGAISRSELNRDASRENPANRNGDYRRNTDITHIANKTAWEDGSNRVDVAVFYTYRELDNPVTTYEYQDNHDVGMRAKYTRSYGASQWLVGVNSYYGNADETRYSNVAGNPGALILTRDLEAFTGEAYAQIDQHLHGGLFGIVSLQGSYATRDVGQQFPTYAEQDKDYTGFSPAIGLRYDITQTNQLFANLSRSFEPPTWGELSGGNSPGFNDLKAQTATTAEIGARGEYKKLNWQAAYFHGWLRHEFVNYRFPDNSTDTINAQRSKRDGIELSLMGDAANDVHVKGDAIAIRTAYTLSHFTLDDDPLYGNNKLPGVPEHYVRAEALYRHPSGVSLGPNVEWSPSASPVDLTNSFDAKPYAIYGLRAMWERDDAPWSAYIEGRNLLNASYAATTNVIPAANGNDGRYFHPGEGRAVYVGMRWSM